MHRFLFRMLVSLILLNKRLNERSHNRRRLLRVSLLSTRVINICNTESRFITFSPVIQLVLLYHLMSSITKVGNIPLKIIHQTPRHVTSDINTIFFNSLSQGSEVASEVLGSELIIENLLLRQVVLPL